MKKLKKNSLISFTLIIIMVLSLVSAPNLSADAENQYLEVRIAFQSVNLTHGSGLGSMTLYATAIDGSAFSQFIDWESANVSFQTGVKDTDNNYTYTTINSNRFNILHSGKFFVDWWSNGSQINLSTLDAIRIPAGTIIKPTQSSRSIKIVNTLTVVKGEDGSWVAEPTDIQLSYRAFTATNQLALNFVGQKGETLNTSGQWYRASAQIDGTENQVLLQTAVANDGTPIIWIYNNCFSPTPGANSKIPQVSFEMKKGTELTPLTSPNSDGVVDVTEPFCRLNGGFYITCEDGVWSQKKQVDLQYRVKNASDDFAFTSSMSEGVAENGWYLTEVLIDGEKKQILIEAYNYGTPTFIVYHNCFTSKPNNNSTVPTRTFVIEEGTVFKPVITNQWDTVDTTRSHYVLGARTQIAYDGKEWRSILDIEVDYIRESDGNFRFVAQLPSGGAPVDSWYRANVYKDGSSELSTVYIDCYDSKFYIYPQNFCETTPPAMSLSVPPTQSMKFAAGTVFTKIDIANSWKDDTSGPHYVLKEEINLEISRDNTAWVLQEDNYDAGDVNGDLAVDVRDIIHYEKWNMDAKTNVTGGADVNGNGILDDYDRVGDLLIGKTFPVKSYIEFITEASSAYIIVRPDNWTKNEQIAVEELQSFIRQATGVRLRVEAESENNNTKRNIYIGATNAAENAGINPTYEEVLNNGFVIKMVDQCVYLRGYSDVGTRNAVYEFLNYALDYECYADNAIELTQTTNMKMLDWDLTVTPDFDWRNAPYGEFVYNPTQDGKGTLVAAGDNAFSNRMRFNNTHEMFMSGYNYHNTVNMMLDAGYSLSDYSEFYSKIDGTHQATHLCYSNKDMQAEFKKVLLNTIEQYYTEHAGEANLPTEFVLGMGDSQTWCQCSTCKASKSKYGTDAVVMIEFINEMQAYLDTTEHSNIRLIMLAYQSTIKPPTEYVNGLWQLISGAPVLNEKSGIIFAPINARIDIPFSDTDATSINATHGQFLGWKEVTNNIYAWIYSTFPYQGLIYNNSIDTMQQNYQWFKEQGVKGIIDQGESYQKFGNTAFTRLKAYLMSKLQWDTSLDIEELITDFCTNYFGEAGQTMQDILNKERQMFRDMYASVPYDSSNAVGLVHSIYYGRDENEQGVGISNLSTVNSHWRQETVNEYLGLIEQAYTDIAPLQISDIGRYNTLKTRILLESMQFRYVNLELYDTDKTKRQEFKADFEALGLQQYYEWEFHEGRPESNRLWVKWGLSE